MRREIEWRKNAGIFVLMAGLLAAGFVLPGCGGEEEPAPEVAPIAAPEAVSAPGSEAKPVETAVAAIPEGAPLTYALLQLTPANAQVAVALPPLNGVLKKILALDTRLPEVSLAALLDEALQDLREDAGVPDAESLDDVAAAKGLNLDAPMAVFTDLTPTVDSLKAAYVAVQSASVPPAEGDAAGAAPPVAPMVDWEEEADPPACAVVLPVRDMAKAEAALAEAVAVLGGFGVTKGDPVTAAGVTIQVYDDYGYFMTDDRVVLGNLDLVKGVAERLKDPAEIRYGTEACPATAPDELAVLAYGDRLIPMAKEVLPTLRSDPLSAAILQAQMASMDALMSTGGADDPMVMTLAWTDALLELKTRLDTETHPELIELSGAPVPLRLAQVLPKGSLALLDIVLTEETKKQITQVYLGNLPPEVLQEPGAAQGIAMAGQVVRMLGNEVTLGVSALEGDMPGVFLLVALAEPEASKGLLQMFVPMEQVEEYNGMIFSQVQAEMSPVPVYAAFIDDVVMAGTDIDKLKAMADLLKAGESSGFFEALDPPIDGAAPRYGAYLVNTALLSDVLLPMAPLVGAAAPPESVALATRVAGLLRELRVLYEMEDTWISSTMTLYLAPEAA